MDSQTRAIVISGHVTRAIIDEGIDFGWDYAKIFSADLGMNLGSFKGLLDIIEDRINEDATLRLLSEFEWIAIPSSDTAPRQNFAEHFLQKSIAELIRKIDAVLVFSPYA